MPRDDLLGSNVDIAPHAQVRGTVRRVVGGMRLALVFGHRPLGGVPGFGAQTRRTDNNLWHGEDRLEIHPHDAEERGVKDDDWVGIQSRAGETVLRATVSERMQPGVVYTTFHFPESGANVITTDNSDWATNCPEYKVTAVQVSPSNGPSEWQVEYDEQARQSRRIASKMEAAE